MKNVNRLCGTGTPMLLSLVFVLLFSFPGVQQVKATLTTSGPSATLALEPFAASGSYCSTEDLFVGNPSFEGCWSDIDLDLDAQTLTFTLQGGGNEPMPANAEIAVVHLHDPVAGTDREFLVATDGGATIMILDDF